MIQSGPCCERRLQCGLSHYQPLIERIIAQSERWVPTGERGLARDKLISLFEPRADIVDHWPERLDPRPMITPPSTVERLARGRLAGCPKAIQVRPR